MARRFAAVTSSDERSMPQALGVKAHGYPPTSPNPLNGRERSDSHAVRSHVRPALMVIVAAALVIALGIALNLFSTHVDDSVIDAPSSIESLVMGGDAIDKSISSTPREMWKRGSVPKLYQKDPQWAEESYADGTIGTHGCGPTCLAMAYVALTGNDDMDPSDIAEFSELNGFVDEGMTAWALMGEGASLLGLESEELPASADVVRSYLEDGLPVICSVHKGDFTTDGHFILLAGIARDGNVEVRDPNSPSRTSQTWELDRIIDQCDNLWALSLP